MMRVPGDMLTVCHEPTNKIRLTDEEIREALDEWEEIEDTDGKTDLEVEIDGHRFIAQAQLKKVVEWGGERCPHTKNFPDTVDRPMPELMRWKGYCPRCWQSLLDEVKEA